MNNFLDLGINLLAAFIGFLVARAVSRIRYLNRTRHVRRLWGVFDAGARIDIVIPVFTDPEIEKHEASGHVGLGDLRGLLELQETLQEIDHDSRVVEAEKFTSPTASPGQILVGSPDSNRYTGAALSELASDVRFGDGDEWNVIEDVKTGRKFYTESVESDSVYKRYFRLTRRQLPSRLTRRQLPSRLTRDIGIIVSAPSTLSSTGHMIVLAGAFGYGTQAAVKLVTQSLARIREAGVDVSRPFEVIFSVPIVERDIIDPKIEEARNFSGTGAGNPDPATIGRLPTS